MFKFIFQCLRFILRILIIILNFTPLLLRKLAHKINKRLRFSISFKITAVYTLIFSITLFVLSVSLIIGFRFFLINEVKDELAKYNTVVINYAKLGKGLQILNSGIFANIKDRKSVV